jgi:hypothetical protein
MIDPDVSLYARDIPEEFLSLGEKLIQIASRMAELSEGGLRLRHYPQDLTHFYPYRFAGSSAPGEEHALYRKKP